MKSKLAFIIPCALIICVLSGILVYAQINKNLITEGTFSYSLNEDGESYAIGSAELGMSFGEQLIIPSSFNGMPVTEIRAEAFKSSQGIKRVIIPASVKKIDYEAFKDCKALEMVLFEEGSAVESIGNAAFNGCVRLKSVDLPKGIKYISYNLFYGCNNLEFVGIPSGVVKIGSGAFGYCVSLEQISIPSTVETIGDSAFYNCRRLKTVDFGDLERSWLKHIGRYAFRDCEGLVDIVFPEKIKDIGECAFAYCEALESVKFTGSSLMDIGASAFIGCASLNKVDIADIANWCSVNFLGDDYSNPIYLAQRLFHNGSLVLRLEIPYGVTTISARAFKNATRIVSVTIPRDFNHEAGAIGTDAFRFCYKLAEIHNFSTMQISTVESEFENFGYIAAYVQNVYNWESREYPMSGDVYPYGEAGKIYSADEFTNYKTKIYSYGEKNEFLFYKDEASHYLLGYIGDESEIILPEINEKYGIFIGAFFGQRGISSVVVPNCVTQIWHFAFYSATDLKRIYISKSVDSIGDRLFGNTEGLEVYLEADDHRVGWKYSYANSATDIKIYFSKSLDDFYEEKE